MIAAAFKRSNRSHLKRRGRFGIWKTTVYRRLRETGQAAA